MSEGARSGTRSRIGNDVMDLRHPRCAERLGGDPLLDRILLPEERRWLDALGDHLWTVGLWALWSSKESAYKVHQKLGSDAAFLPRTFRCELEAEGPDNGGIIRIRGEVHRAANAISMQLEGSSNESYLHLIGWDGSTARPRRGRLELGLEELDPGDPDLPLEAFRENFTPDEWAGVYSVRSARARLLARDRIRVHLGSLLGRRPGQDRSRSEGRIEIRTSAERPGRAPPRIWYENREVADFDLSLSHHGRFVAWALLVPED